MYIPLHCHSHFSLLDGLSKPTQIAERIVELGLPGCALTDHGALYGSVEFYKAMKKVGKKVILGCELYISELDANIQHKDNKTSHLVVLAKNLQGWKKLVKLTSESNHPELFYRKPRLDIGRLAKYCNDDLISFSGHMGSELANVLFVDPKATFNTNLNAEQIRGLLVSDWEKRASEKADKFASIFGKSNFYVEIQLMDCIVSPAQTVISDCLRKVAKELGLKCVATPDAHYCRKEDAIDQRVILCSALQTTLGAVQQKINDADDVTMGTFFKSDCYHIPSFDELKSVHTEDELRNSLEIGEKCEDYNILRNPILPEYKCPNNAQPDEYLRQLCREGWTKKIANKIDKQEQAIYTERTKGELLVLQGAGLSPYFLIVADIMNYVRSNDWMPGPGRGSAAGCLVSYLTNITSIDPIKYDLMFERFYNAGRNTKDRVSMPDIDMDIPTEKRGQIIDYIKNKYGHNRVCQMVSFQTMKGRSSIKDVVRAYGGISFELMNQITKPIPDEATIADELQEMKDETGESSIIKWALENEANKLKEWCSLDKDGNLVGPLAKRFEQAIRLEGTKRGKSRHPAGIIIAPFDLDDICPMILDTETKSLMGGWDMYSAEDAGLLKFDVLGVNAFDKLMTIQKIVAGENYDE